MEYHKNDIRTTEQSSESTGSDIISEWDQNFMKMDQGSLFEIILAANYLDLKQLLDLGKAFYLASSAYALKTYHILNL